MNRFVLWLYRMQQRLEITRGESIALLTLLGLLMLGITARALQRRPVPPTPDPPVAVKSEPAPRMKTTLPGANRGHDSVDRERARSALSPKVQTNRIDLNTASIEDLKKLPGIGPVLASRIDQYRSINGPFRQVGDLRQIRGIGEKTVAQLEMLVAVRGPTQNVTPE